VWVSAVAQTLGQQNAAMAAAGATKTFSDTLSGAKDDRPESHCHGEAYEGRRPYREGHAKYLGVSGATLYRGLADEAA
jgi:hypothetical protein